MPKTYNQRQLDQMRVEVEREPPGSDEAAPDTLRHFRFFPPNEIEALIQRIEARIASDRVTQLSPATAYLVAKTLRAWNATPKREDLVREICGVKGGCENRCLTCIGRANA